MFSEGRICKAFPFCAIPGEIKLDSDCDADTCLIPQAVYARQCFITQKNRKFFYSLALTGTTAQFYQFYRSGAQRSTKINIHVDAVHFVPLVLGVCSLDDRIIGFDTAVVLGGRPRISNDEGRERKSIQLSATVVLPVMPVEPFEVAAPSVGTQRVRMEQR
ncbi:hypothetical protein BDZ97DRAFT_1916139 [Flammula alnicola]|nr:hypothetical protein BDZ97DRAFT_1916139 [Flammula alnicola]